MLALIYIAVAVMAFVVIVGSGISSFYSNGKPDLPEVPINTIMDLNPDCLLTNSTGIYVLCGSANISTLEDKLEPEFITKEASKQWLLSDNLIVAEGATLFINSTDTNWLKLDSTSGTANKLEVKGELFIDNTKITSWDTITNAYAPISENGAIPRSYIEVIGGNAHATITDSEIAYLGYQASHAFGLTFYAHDITITNNEIHHLNYGFYSHTSDSYNILIEGNTCHSNRLYCFDPHSGTHDITIRDNTVYNNGLHGIICSDDCYNVLIEGNHVFGNFGDGIMLYRNITNSIVQNNHVHGQVDDGISVYLNSTNNSIIGNTIEGHKNGIRLNNDSAYNDVSNNVIDGPLFIGVYVHSGSNNNSGSGNIITNYGDEAIYYSPTAGCCNDIS